MSMTSSTATVTTDNRQGCDATGWLVLPEAIAGEIDQLHCGTVILTVPLLRGVIQVGSAGPLPTAKIEVRKSQSAVTVRRTDGVALQAQIVRRADNGPASRSDVFTEPVGELRIQRDMQPDRTHVWSVASGDLRGPSAGLFQLITTIVTFGLAKQGNVADRERLPASA